MALLIYAPKINPRKIYVFEHIFTNILGVKYQISDDLDFFNQFDGIKICYHSAPVYHPISFISHPFMDEKTIQNVVLAFADFDGYTVPFVVKHSVFDFDVFAVTFYFLSRYEEYLINERDAHGRFKGKNALAFKLGFLNRPIIDEWAFLIADEIKKHFPDFEIKKRNFQFIPTLDIDRPYYYQTDTLFKKLLKKVKHGFQKDPFDVYEQVKIWDKKFGFKTIYFFLMGNKHLNDPAPSIRHPLFQKAIRQIKETNSLGIHPSYFSHLKPEEVLIEKESLVKISDQKIQHSRQHYLLLSFPKTYRDLIKSGIKEDFTLAFADEVGFRASTCTPFLWYDLEKEEMSNLWIWPTAMMDQTLRKYQGLPPKEAITVINDLIENVKKVNGTFISLWHNESINDFGVWKGWKNVYLTMLENGAQNQKS